MTPPTDLGREPPKQRYTISTPDEFDETFVVERYADYWRRRALAAEGLLREAWKNQYLVEWEARVAQHFAGAEGEK